MPVVGGAIVPSEDSPTALGFHTASPIPIYLTIGDINLHHFRTLLQKTHVPSTLAGIHMFMVPI